MSALEVSPHRLGDLLLARQLITPAQLGVALREQKHSPLRLGEILVGKHWLTRVQVKQTLKWQSMLRAATVLASLTFSPLVAAEPETSVHSPVYKMSDAKLDAGSSQAWDPVTYSSYSKRAFSTSTFSKSTFNKSTFSKSTFSKSAYSKSAYSNLPITSQSAAYGPGFKPTASAAGQVSGSSTFIDQLKAEFKSHIGTPLYTLFKGEYIGGVDIDTTGMAYKAEWSDSGLAFEVKYQF